MTYAMVHQPASNNAQSPFRVIVQKTGRQVDWIAGFGWGGQRLYVVPSRELTIVVFSGAYGKPQVVGNTVLNDYVLAAFNAKPDPTRP